MIKIGSAPEEEGFRRRTSIDQNRAFALETFSRIP